MTWNPRTRLDEEVANVARLRTDVVGREDEVTELRRLQRESAIALVRGEAGIGKSAVLARLGAQLRAEGTAVIEVQPGGGAPDAAGAGALLDAIRARFEEFGAGPQLADAMRSVGRACFPAADGTEPDQSTVRGPLGKLFAAIGAGRHVAFLVGDLHEQPRSARWFRLAQEAGHTVVAASALPGGCVGSEVWLESVADEVIDLAALDDRDMRAIIRRRVGGPVDAGLLRALDEALQDLRGNPGAVLSVLADLRGRGRLTAIHGNVCLRDPAEPIPLGEEHPLLAEVGRLGEFGRYLVLLASSEAGFGVDQLPAFAAAVGRPVVECGQAVDEFVRSGVLRTDASGTLYGRCPALGARLVEQIEPGAVRELHARIAVAMLETGTLGRSDEHVLLRHADLAGTALPAHRALPTLLERDDLVSEGALGTQVAWLAVLRRHHPQRRDTVLPTLLRSLVRAGEYARLAALVDEVVADVDTRCAPHAQVREEVAAAAALAAMHLGRPIPALAADVLRGPDGGWAAVDLCASWFRGVPISVAEVEHAFAVLAESDTRRRCADPRVAAACAIRDLVPVFEAALGGAYRAPESGPLAAQHRLGTGFASADWDDALSAACERARTTGIDPLGNRFACLIAAEICTWQGKDEQAESWLSSVPDGGTTEAMRGWVACGLRYRGDDPVGALSAGWAAYRKGDESGPGGPELLSRLAVIAVEVGDQRFARRLLAEADARHLRESSARSREARLLVRGLVERDVPRLRAAEWLVRARGHQPDLVWTCFAAGLVAGDPARWLHEAHHLTRTSAAKALHARVKQLTVERGVPAPPKPSWTDDFSDLERKMVDLIRSGRTNRQIAAAVVISEKTVEKYLTRIFLKTGHRTRHELAAASLHGRLEQVGA